MGDNNYYDQMWEARHERDEALREVAKRDKQIEELKIDLMAYRIALKDKVTL